MFRPPPTVVEVGNDADIQQFHEMVFRKEVPKTPPMRSQKVFESPDPAERQRTIISTPTGAPYSPDNSSF